MNTWYIAPVGYELELLPVPTPNPLPLFDALGNLPLGDYWPLREEFEGRFVSLTARRGRIYSGWNRHRDALLEAGLAPACRQLLNGSFTTSKPLPGDLDLAVEVPVSSSTDLPHLTQTSPISSLLGGPAMKAGFDCDAYPIFILPETDAHYENVTVEGIRYWTKWFGRTRDGRSKGRVWAQVEGLA